MLQHKTLRAAVAIAVAVGAAAAFVPGVAAARSTFAVSGRQITIDENAGTYLMRGGLRGMWQTTSFDEIAKEPIYQAKGTETFKGCLDRRADRSCAGDPTGTLNFSFLYWASFDSSGALQWGACYHPITSGTGDFRGATGVLMFADTPVGNGTRTAYTGNVTLANGSPSRGHRAAVARAATTVGCG